MWHTNTTACMNTHTNSGILFSHKKEWNLAICYNMVEAWGHMLSKISQRKTNTVWSHLYVESKKEKHKWAYRYREQIGGCQRHGVVGGRNGWWGGEMGEEGEKWVKDTDFWLLNK